MVPSRPSSGTVGIVIVTAVTTLLLAGSVNSLPGFADQTGATELAVTEFERLESGCLADLADYSRASVSGGVRTQNTVIETVDTDASLSVTTERLTPLGADVSVFRVDVASHHAGPVEADCVESAAVRYRLELTPRGGSQAGLLADEHGTVVRMAENGEVWGCSGYDTRPPDVCLSHEPSRTWTNATR
jgi:hypothetical protein